MVDSGTRDLSENEGFKSDLESEKKNVDSKDEAGLSFYECPTAAASIQGFGEHNRYTSNSLDSEQDYSYYEAFGKADSLLASNSSDSPSPPGLGSTSDLGPNSTDGGSVSFSQFTRPEGGYFAGYQAVLYEGNPTLKGKPTAFLDENSLRLAENHTDFNHLHESRGYSEPSMEPGVNPGEGANGFAGQFALGVPAPTAAEGFTSSGPNPTLSTNFPTNQVGTPFQVPYTSTVDNGAAYTVTSVRTENTNRTEFPAPATATHQGSLLPAIVEAGSSSSSLSVSGQTSNLSYVQEGFDTIAVPRYRPVEVVETTVEVPVVHHIDTFVPKKEIQEVESYVKKPYTKYVDKVVEVPQVHYTDKIVEVPEYHEVTKTVPKLEVQEKTNYVPKVEVKVVPKYVEVPVVKIVDKYEEYEQVEEVVKHVEKVEVVEVPREVVKTVVKPVRKIVEREKIVPVYEHRDVPVEKIKYVPKIETVEHVREVPKVVDVPVPYNVPRHQFVDQPYVVPKYRDVPVAVPVAKTVKPVYEDKGPTNYIDVPVHKPYFVIHDHLNFKPVNSFSPGEANANPFANLNVGGFNANCGFNTLNTGAGHNPGNPPSNNYTFKDFGGNPGFSHGSQFKDFQEVSYKVVGMNRVDLDKMPPEERKLAQEKLNEALENPNFQVYKQSMAEGSGGAGFNSFDNPVVGPSDGNPTNFANNFTNVSSTVNQAGGFSSWGPNGFNTDFNSNNFNNPGFKPEFAANDPKLNQAPNELGGGKVATNGAGNGWSPDFGAGNPAANWGRWNSAAFNNTHTTNHNPNPNLNPNFHPNFNNLNNRYKYDGNYSSSLSNWTDKLFKFFTGSKTPTPPASQGPFNQANAPLNPNYPRNVNSGGFRAPPTTNPNFSGNNPFAGAGGAAPGANFWDRSNYNLVQESFRNWKVPNMHLDLERNTPNNRLNFRDASAHTGRGRFFGRWNHYPMSSGSGSVGHRGGFDRPSVYPASDASTPKVH